MVKKKKIAGITIALFTAVVLGALLCSCSELTYESVVVMPPMMPGASFVGSETCSGCHEDEYRYFSLSDHSRVSIRISDEDAEAGEAESCETCHGPGSSHVEDYGNKDKIILSDPETCFSCHLDIKGQFLLQHHHPVREGIMTCSDCHSMHGDDVRATGRQLLMGAYEKCFNCHKDQKGPFVFVHDVMRDGCGACHNPHGSINDKLLIAGQTTTCMNCHWEVKFNTAQGNLGSFPHGFMAGIGAGEECIDCHTAPHGSNISRSFRR